MAKIKVKGYKDPYGGSDVNNRIVFSLVSSPAEGRKQISLMQQCRGYICEMAAAAADGDRCDFPQVTDEADVDMNRLRLMVSTNSRNKDEFKKRLFNAKKFINVLEKFTGWKTSKISTVDNDVYSEPMWLITGPKEWMSAPGLLSAFMLILRGMTSPQADSIKFKGSADINKVFKDLSKCLYRNSFSNIQGTDGNDFDFVSENFKDILKNYDSIFKDTTLSERYVGGVHTAHGNGVVALCKGETGCEKVNKRVKNL